MWTESIPLSQTTTNTAVDGAAAATATAISRSHPSEIGWSSTHTTSPMIPSEDSTTTIQLLQDKIAVLERTLQEVVQAMKSGNASRVALPSWEPQQQQQLQQQQIYGSPNHKHIMSQISKIERKLKLSEAANQVHLKAINELHRLMAEMNKGRGYGGGNGNGNGGAGTVPARAMRQLERDVTQLNYETYKKHIVEGKNIPQIVKDDDGWEYLNPFYEPMNSTRTFCISWNVSSDLWWTHHVDWEVTNETDHGYCFHSFADTLKGFVLRSLYDIQFRGDCDVARTKRMWSSGWGADIANVVDGLRYALETHQPTTIDTSQPWHYAAKKDGSRPVCPEMGLGCYFLPISRCEPDPFKAWSGNFYLQWQPNNLKPDIRWYTMFATRPQTWIRKEVYEFSKTTLSSLTEPCSVIHIRRGDVVLHGEFSRRYFAVDDYMKAGKDILTKTIFLLTDDENAIKEAKAKYPQHDWVVIDRPRFKGPEGGFENHIPSNDPKLEVIVLLSIFKLVPKCKVFVHSKSNLSRYIAGVMMDVQRSNLTRIDLSKGQANHGKHHSKTSQISKSDW